MSESAGRVCAVEVDAYLATRLAESMAARAEIVCEDFRTFALPSEPYKVVSNVPYGITTDIVKKLIAAPRPPSDAWLIVQRELAERLCGRPYTNETLWSLRLKPGWHVEIVERIKRTDFEPAPRVESVLMWLSHRGRSLLSAGERRIYLRMITTAYRDRAALKHVVQPWVSKRQLAQLARDLRFAPTLGPSALLFEQWLGIVRFASRNSRGDARC